MRYYKKNNGLVAAFDDDQLTKSELIDKIEQLNAELELTDQYVGLTSAKNALDAIDGDSTEGYKVAVRRLAIAQSEYESCDEYIALERAKSTKVWIPDAAVEMSEEEIQAHLNPVVTDEQLAATARAKRDALLEQFTWRYERNAREARLGIETTDSIEALDIYTQALADVPQQEGFPTTIEWPEIPA